jgi:mono/diheme cytochrome c family protein
MKHRRASLFPACSLLLLFAACGGDDGATTKTTRPTTAPAASKAKAPTARQLQEAKALFASLCVTCHGTTGHGDGPGSGPLNPKPRSFADAAWQASVTDDHIKKVITLGGAAVGKSPMMPAQPALKGQTAVLDGLVQIVRGFNTQ